MTVNYYPGDRSDLNQTLIEPFLNYNPGKRLYLITDSIITANWDADCGNRWTVPLGGGIGKLLKISDQAINVRTECLTHRAENLCNNLDYGRPKHK